MNILWFRSQPPTPTPSPPGLKTPLKNEPNLNFLRNHLTNRDDFFNLSFYAYKRASSLEANPQPSGALKTLKNEHNLNFLRNHSTNRNDFLNLSFYGYKLTFGLEVTPRRQPLALQVTKKNLKMNLTLIFSETIRPIEMIS